MIFRRRADIAARQRRCSRAAALAAAAVLTLITAPVAAQDSAAALVGTWRGSYTCFQGLTALELVVERAGDHIDARFIFSAHPNNPGVPSGSFRMAGTVDAKSRRVVLEPREWIDEPPGYVMVGLVGMLTVDGQRMSGRVQAEGCTVFTLSRAGK